MNTSLYEDGYNEATRISDEKIKSLEQKINALKQAYNAVKQENTAVKQAYNAVMQRIVNNLRSKGFSDVEINNLTEFSLDDIKSV